MKALYLRIMCNLLTLTANVQTICHSPELRSLLVTMGISVKEEVLQSATSQKVQPSFPDLVTAQARFFLTVALCLGVSEDDRLDTTTIMVPCLTHHDSYVREWTLNHVNSSMALESSRGAVLSGVVQLFFSEKDEDVLTQVC